jgi:hypothetical protein
MTEAEAIECLLDLFNQVQARQPQKGVASLLARARQMPLPYEQALTSIVADATQRTHARLALMGDTCQLNLHNSPDV